MRIFEVLLHVEVLHGHSFHHLCDVHLIEVFVHLVHANMDQVFNCGCYRAGVVIMFGSLSVAVFKMLVSRNSSRVKQLKAVKVVVLWEIGAT